MPISQYEICFNNLLSNILEGVAIHHLIFDNTGVPIDYLILKVNNGFEEMFGYTKLELEGKLASELYDNVPALENYSDVVLNKTSKKFEYYYLTTNKYFQVSVAPWNNIGFISIFTDITDKILTQKKLEENDNRLIRAEIISKTGNWELHIENQIILASNGAKKIYGISNDLNYIKYEDVKNYVLPEYREFLDIELKKLIEFDKDYDVEFKIKTNNEIKTIHSIANYDKKNKIVFGILQDISVQKQNEEALEKSNAVKSTFLSNISHELRTPMSAIIGYSDIILKNNNNVDTLRFLKSIKSNAKHLHELLNNILDYSKIESESLDVYYDNFSILELFEDLHDIFDDENYNKNLNFVKLEFISNKDKIIVSDYLRLKQVLYNIISNSIKFTENGYIRISFEIFFDYVEFKIEDTGIGIPEEKISFVFDRFWQCDSSSKKKYKGTGLGLSISKSIVDLLNGKIWLESVLNKGTTFYIRIPSENKIIK